MNARVKDRSSGYTDVARAYAEQVVAGEILACRWVQQACQRQLDDLAKFKGKASPYLFNPKLTDKDGRSFQPADNLCAFFERLPLLRAGVDINTIRAWLGHVSLDTTHVYAEVDLEMKAKALAAVELPSIDLPDGQNQLPSLMAFMKGL